MTGRAVRRSADAAAADAAANNNKTLPKGLRLLRNGCSRHDFLSVIPKWTAVCATVQLKLMTTRPTGAPMVT